MCWNPALKACAPTGSSSLLWQRNSKSRKAKLFKLGIVLFECAKTAMVSGKAGKSQAIQGEKMDVNEIFKN